MAQLYGFVRGFICVFLLLLISCSMGEEDDSSDFAATPIADSQQGPDSDFVNPPQGPSFAQEPVVAFTATSGATLQIDVELAATPAERQQGLMFREELQEFSGMLFLFQQPDNYLFTMENTLIPLDIIFIDSNQRVVGIVANAPPETEGPYGVNTLSNYVLEVNAGFAARYGIEIGDLLDFRGIFPEGAVSSNEDRRGAEEAGDQVNEERF